MNQPRLKSILWGTAAFALVCGILQPFFQTGFYHDDALNSLLDSYIKTNGWTFWQFVFQNIGEWLHKNGRFYPFAQIFGYGGWYFFKDLALYRFTQMALVLVNILLFMRVLAELGATKNARLLIGLITLGLFQIRDYHDPIASYQALLQILFLLGMGSILLLLRFKATGKSVFLVSSVGLYALSLLTYETILSFFPILIFFSLRGDKVRGKKALISFGLLLIAFFTMTFWIRTHFPLGYEGTRIGISARFLTAFLFQMSATVPLSYAIFGRSGFFKPDHLLYSSLFSWTQLFIFAASAWIIFGLIRKSEKIPAQISRVAMLFAGALIVFPSILVALSSKYQGEINRPGIGYLPVYLSYFGMATLLGLWIVNKVKAVWQSIIVSLICALVMTITVGANTIAVEKMNQVWRYPRELVEGAARAGLFKGLPEQALLLHGTRYHPWLRSDYLLELSGKNFRPSNYDDWYGGMFAPAPFIDGQSVSGTYFLRFDNLESSQGQIHHGQVILSEISRIEWDGNRHQVIRILGPGNVRVFSLTNTKGTSAQMDFTGNLLGL